MDAESLTFDDESFDVVLGNLSIFFFDIERSLREWFRVLRPGGRLGFTDFGAGDQRWDWHRDLCSRFAATTPGRARRLLRSPTNGAPPRTGS